MGQPITVAVTAMHETAIFDLDRSLTGQDGMSFQAPPHDGDDRPPARLARMLLADQQTTGVHILSNLVTVTRRTAWEQDDLDTTARLISNLFLYYRPEDPEELAERLRLHHYNSTITHIRAHNPELWVLRVRHDEPLDPYKAGQYTTLALGYWEPRADDALEDFDSDPDLWEKLVRRSYSVSSSIVDDDGNLVPAHPEEVEFYVVQVRPDRGPGIPGLTPRIFKKRVGDRIFLGRKFTGRYTLDDVSPTDNVVFLSTGTGEAPQNAMVAELLRGQHQGRILSVVCVRYRSDLAYLEQQQIVQDRYPSYKYVVLTTREPENEGNKVYIQDMIVSGLLEEELGEPLDPAKTHVYLCGNPAMIGIPEWTDAGEPVFPEDLGVCQILTERGFKVDRHKDRGNVHYEEYW
jgi:ferredoxin/flavodoxin---NADP+ reductase